jgi:ParB/RepB/Spo0J family partition protein
MQPNHSIRPALASIHESATNPRRTFDESRLAELAESLRTQGLIQPVTVRPNSDGYEIIAGARASGPHSLRRSKRYPSGSCNSPMNRL